jgi:hypothetical protein
VSWSATAGVAAVAARAAKKILPEGWRFFLSRLFYPCGYVFAEQRARLTNTALPALFCAEAHKKMIYTAKIIKTKIRLRILFFNYLF